MRRLAEEHHHTPEQVKQYAADAVSIADELGLTEADRAALLPQLAAMLGSKQVIFDTASLAASAVLQGIG